MIDKSYEHKICDINIILLAVAYLTNTLARMIAILQQGYCFPHFCINHHFGVFSVTPKFVLFCHKRIVAGRLYMLVIVLGSTRVQS